MRRVWRLSTCWYQIWTFLSDHIFCLLVVLHRCKLLSTWSYGSMSNSFTRLGVEMTADSGRISTRNLVLYLFTSLTLSDVAAKASFLLGRAILAVSNWYRRPFPSLIPCRRGRGFVRLKSLSVRSRQSVAVVLTTVCDGECLTLELLLAHLVDWISDKLGTTGGLLEGMLASIYLFFT